MEEHVAALCAHAEAQSGKSPDKHRASERSEKSSADPLPALLFRGAYE
jgi:hypothetical protein